MADRVTWFGCFSETTHCSDNICKCQRCAQLVFFLGWMMFAEAILITGTAEAQISQGPRRLNTSTILNVEHLLIWSCDSRRWSCRLSVLRSLLALLLTVCVLDIIARKLARKIRISWVAVESCQFFESLLCQRKKALLYEQSAIVPRYAFKWPTSQADCFLTCSKGIISPGLLKNGFSTLSVRKPCNSSYASTKKLLS